MQKLFSGYYHDETMAACAAKEGPQSFTQEVDGKPDQVSSSQQSNGGKTASHSFAASSVINHPAMSDKSSSNKRASAY